LSQQVFPLRVDYTLIMEVLLSFGLGALIGLEREKARVSASEEGEREFPGIRSVGLISMISTLATKVYGHLMEAGEAELARVVLLASLSTVVFLIAAYMAYRFFVQGSAGITTGVAMSLALMVGVVVGVGLIMEAVALAFFTTFILAIKPGLERFVRGISYKELLSVLEVGIMVFVFSPLLLTDIYDPIFHFFNFRIVYAFFTLTLTLSLANYIALRTLRGRGVRYFALLGGMVNSEATVVNVVRSLGSIAPELALEGVMLASCSMVLRNLILASALASMLRGLDTAKTLAYIILTFSPALLVGIAYLARRRDEGSYDFEDIGSPLSFGMAIRAAVMYVIVLSLTAALSHIIKGSLGILVSSFIGGLINAGATILSVANLAAASSIDPATLAASAALASSSAVLNKIIFAKSVGAPGEVMKAITIYTVLYSLALMVPAVLTAALG